MSPRPSDYAANFAINDAVTRRYVRDELIPRWHRTIEENRELIERLRAVGRTSDDAMFATVLAETRELKANLATAESRLYEHCQRQEEGS